MFPGLAELWEGAKVVHHAAMVEIFGLEPAQVAAMYASTFVSTSKSPAPVSNSEGEMITLFEYFIRMAAKSERVLRTTLWG